jgi:transcriptional regulator with XRE-family HTH domain
MEARSDKRARAAQLRQRLREAMERAGVSGSALARAAGVDRSTVSQLLAEDSTRLPGAHLAADAAATLGVSADWLLGLTDRPERPGDLLAAAVDLTEAERARVDDRLLAWHREAAGAKIRHVPASLPDMLKTEDVLRAEYAAHLGRTPDQAVRAMQERLALLRDGDSDFEIALPVHELASFAEGSGYWQGIGRDIRADQLERLAGFLDAHFPALRLHLFDKRRVFSASLTVFGPRIGVIYVGRFYLAFRETARVRALSQHFDWLVREAAVDARDAAAHVAALRDRV